MIYKNPRDYLLIEPMGLLSLTRWNDDKTPHITREVVCAYVHQYINKKIHELERQQQTASVSTSPAQGKSTSAS